MEGRARAPKEARQTEAKEQGNARRLCPLPLLGGPRLRTTRPSRQRQGEEEEEVGPARGGSEREPSRLAGA